MKKSTNLIYYPAGCYGTFIEWVCQHFYNNLVLDEYPFTENGSSHKYLGNLLYPAPKIIEYIESEQTFEFVRIISSIFEEVNSFEKIENNSQNDIVQEDLTFLNQHFNKIIVLHPSDDSRMWLNNNVLDKCFITDEEFKIVFEPYGYTKEFLSASLIRDPNEKLKNIIKKELSFEQAQYWGKKTIDELEHWEFRELLSMYWFERDKDFYSCWEPIRQKFSNNLFVSIDELKNSTPEILEKILNFFDIQNYNVPDLQEISINWQSVQEHKNKDQHINEIISHILLNKSYDWKNINLSILDEAYIQKKLKEQNVEIKCYNLNKFPTNTKIFNNFLIR